MTNVGSPASFSMTLEDIHDQSFVEAIGAAAIQNVSNLKRTSDVMSKPQDGFVSPVSESADSRRITRFLLKFPIHPSVLDDIDFVLPLLPAYFCARRLLSVVIGAAIFQAVQYLDGCDGVIARARNWIEIRGTLDSIL